MVVLCVHNVTHSNSDKAGERTGEKEDDPSLFDDNIVGDGNAEREGKGEKERVSKRDKRKESYTATTPTRGKTQLTQARR